MDPNQQPNQAPSPSPAPQPGGPQSPTTPVAAPYTPSAQVPYQQPTPQPPTSYGVEPQPAYDPNYLDSIAPVAPRPTFFSGSFGKIFFAMIGVFVLAVSLIIAFSGKDNTADLQQIAVRLDNLIKVVKKVQPDLKSNNLSTTNSNYTIWMTDSLRDANDLLSQAGVKKTQYNKEMVSEEATLADELAETFEDARLNATLDRVYARTMASEAEKLMNMFNLMAKQSGAPAIRDYAKTSSANLEPIQKSFDDYIDDGN